MTAHLAVSGGRPAFTLGRRQRPAAILFTLLAGILSLAASLGAAIPPAENLLPADTLLVITVPDFAKLRETIRQSPQGRLWNDPALKPFHDRFMANWNEKFVAPLERDLGIKFDDYAGLPQGQLTLAVTQNGWTGGDDPQPATVLLLDTLNRGGVLKTNLATLRKKWADAGRTVRQETIRGVSFSVVPLSSNDVPATLAALLPKRRPVQELGKVEQPPKPTEAVIGQFESLLIVGNSLKAVEPVVARLTGGSVPALADNALFAADRLAQFRDAPLYYGWLNAKTLFDVLVHIPPPEPNPDAPSPVPPFPWDRVLAASGLTGMKSISFSYRESREGSQVDFYLSVPEASRQGLFKIIAAKPKDANPPSFVPADAVKFWRWRMDGQQAWATLQKMAADISPDWLNSLNSIISFANLAAQQKDPNFDIRKNLLSNLGDDWISYQKAPNSGTLASFDSPPSLFLFAVVNPDQAALSIKNMMSSRSPQGNAAASRQFLGRTIYTLTLPSRRAAGSGSLYCTTSSGYVALSSDVSMIESFLRSADSKARPLRDTAGFAGAAQHVIGPGGGLLIYENQQETMRAFFAAMKNSPPDKGAAAAGALPFGSPGKMLGDWVDFSLLPDFDKVSKYFYFSVTGGSVTADGLSYRIFAPRPPQMEK